MKTRIALLLPILFGAAALLYATAYGQAGDLIVLERADYRADLSMGSPPTTVDVAPRFVIQYANELQTIPLGPMDPVLDGLIGQVADRPIIQYANQTHTYTIVPAPAPLVTLLRSVADRPIIQYANETKTYTVASPPSALTTLLRQVADRPIIQYANQTQTYTLGFPVGIVEDHSGPSLTANTATFQGGSVVRIAATTNEICSLTVQYGTTSGSYPYKADSPNIAAQHSVNLTGIAKNTRYYYCFILKDRSGNATTTGQYSFKLSPLYMPLLRK